MDQNQSADNDLQKAIDNINNPSSEPSFSDPVAAPSTVPEGDSGELGEPVGPFPMPPTDNEPKMGVVTPGPEPIAPIDPVNVPDLGANGNANVTPTIENHDSQPIMPAGNPDNPFKPAEPAPNTEGGMPAMGGDSNNNDQNNNDMGSMMSSGSENEATNTPTATGAEAHQIKEAALKALIPLLKDHVKASPEQKFELCKDIFENLHDSAVFDQAYQAAMEITDEDAQAQALLYIIESIE